MPTVVAVTGSCACGAVRYEITGPARGAEYCHCGMCRKAHGTAFSSNAEIAAADLRVVAGEAELAEFASSAERRKRFCRRCGSQLFIRRLDDPATLVVAMGTLDGDLGIRPSRHVFVDSRAPWADVAADGLPRFRVYPGYEPAGAPADPVPGRHPRFPVAVHVLLLRGDEVLLLRRANTGYEDGRLSVPAGHVEPGESIVAAAVRETREETGLVLATERLAFAHVMHRRAGEERVDFFFTCRLSDETPRNVEPEKCAELVWARLDDLPRDTIAYVRAAAERVRTGVPFQEFGWG